MEAKYAESVSSIGPTLGQNQAGETNQGGTPEALPLDVSSAELTPGKKTNSHGHCGKTRSSQGQSTLRGGGGLTKA